MAQQGKKLVGLEEELSDMCARFDASITQLKRDPSVALNNSNNMAANFQNLNHSDRLQVAELNSKFDTITALTKKLTITESLVAKALYFHTPKPGE